VFISCSASNIRLFEVCIIHLQVIFAGFYMWNFSSVLSISSFLILEFLMPDDRPYPETSCQYFTFTEYSPDAFKQNGAKSPGHCNYQFFLFLQHTLRHSKDKCLSETSRTR
jgi:hypothetical protein